ncbi:MAG TPA: hypothetical protein VE135_06885 [Pyrinomonadaceae bacterium]|nr:hypothetical protein [Pyrinomonadaceae bacterium]
MKHLLLLCLFIVIQSGIARAQTSPSGRPAQSPGVPQRPATSFDLSEYGVDFQADPRLIIIMAALDAAGFDPTPAGREPSVFRTQVRRDLTNLDMDLRGRLRTFYERNKLPAPATAADQSARYVSLALSLGQPPGLDAPERSDDLPGGLLEVLDFAPLVREFYRRSGIDERMPAYLRAYQSEGDRLRRPTSAMVQAVLTYLHTRPLTVATERVEVKAATAGKKKNAPKTYSFRQHDRRFFIIPDLLAEPGTINFRIIGDTYYAIVPEGIDPTSSELRRAYIQYVIDPLILRFNREVAARRDQIRQLLDERQKTGASVSPDVFLAVSRSLVAAADARFDEVRKLAVLSQSTRSQLVNARDDAARTAIAKASQVETAAIQDETIARLAEEYERGAVLSFYFADQLKAIETSGFDVANFFADMISSFDAARENRRPAEYAEARQRALAARQARLAARKAEAETPVYSEAEAARAATLIKRLAEIEEVLRLRDYVNAENRLKELLKDYPREPRIFFALAQTASLAAADATDETVQAERLNRALVNYRFAVEASSPETDRALISRAHESMGRIHAFLENQAEAAKEFDAAIKIGEVRGGAYKEAVEGRRKLNQP